jgi:hypothetical protein
MAAAVAQRAVYHPRDPTASPLWRCLDDHYEDFRRNYPNAFEKSHRFCRSKATSYQPLKGQDAIFKFIKDY